MRNALITSLFRVAGTFALTGLIGIPLFAADMTLPSYNVDLRQTSVSGLSSGAFMATQFHVAFSSTVVGAGIVAGGPFYCAGTPPLTNAYLLNATTVCMNPPAAGPDAAALLTDARTFARLGQIDDPANLKKGKVYLFSGMADRTVTTRVVDQTATFYKLAGLPAQNIKYVINVNAGHAIITGHSNDGTCPITAAPYINDCHFTQSQEILRHIYGNLNPPVSKLGGRMIPFKQSEFLQSSLSSMSDTAYVYVPKSCEQETCKVHVAFHGCEQGATKIGNLFYSTTGYNELADSNRIIVLYPQVQASSGYFAPYNPKGCWDFWGYSSFNPFFPDFYTRQAPQMTAVKAMLDRLAQPRQ